MNFIEVDEIDIVLHFLSKLLPFLFLHFSKPREDINSIWFPWHCYSVLWIASIQSIFCLHHVEPIDSIDIIHTLNLPSIYHRVVLQLRKQFAYNWHLPCDQFTSITRSVSLCMLDTQIAKFMGPTWGPPGSCRLQMGPMLAPWALLSGGKPYVSAWC